MADEWDDNEDEATGSEDPGNLVRDLRKQLKQTARDNKTLADELRSLKDAERQRSVNQLLESKGLSPKIATFIPSGLKGEDEIGKWLDDYSDVFGATVPEAKPDEAEPDDADLMPDDRAEKLGERGLAPSKLADMEGRIANANSLDEIRKVFREAQQYMM